MRHIILPLIVLTTILTSCGDFFKTNDGKNVNLTVKVNPETKALQPISELATRINIMLFDLQGNKQWSKLYAQTTDSPDFGKVALNIPAGTYILVTIAHSSPANCTFTSANKVSFTLKDGVKITDTFTGFDTIEITGEEQDIDAILERKTSRVRFYFTDEEIPESIVKFRFKYTGGSATIDPNGVGYTKSTQTETRSVNSEGIYDIYTFAYQDTKGYLDITAEALDLGENVIATYTFKDIFIEMGYSTELTGNFFNSEGQSGNIANCGFLADGEWKGTYTYTF